MKDLRNSSGDFAAYLVLRLLSINTFAPKSRPATGRQLAMPQSYRGLRKSLQTEFIGNDLLPKRAEQNVESVENLCAVCEGTLHPSHSSIFRKLTYDSHWDGFKKNCIASLRHFRFDGHAPSNPLQASLNGRVPSKGWLKSRDTLYKRQISLLAYRSESWKSDEM
jgi:hypothetical protein